MLAVEQIEEWLGQEVLDCDGEKVGKLDDVFYSEAGQEAVFAAVKRGLLGRRSTLVPLAGATVGRDYVKLSYSTAQIDEAEVDTGKADTLDAADTQRLGEAFGVQIASGEIQSASSINARQRAAEEAAERASELDEEAQRRAVEAQDAQSDAADATADASQKAADARAAKEAAERAHADAGSTNPGS